MKRTVTVLWMFYICIITSIFCTAQTTSIDSIKKRMWGEELPVKKLKLLIDLCKHHQSINKDSLYQYARLANALELQDKSGSMKTEVLLIAINTCLRLGKTDSAATLAEQGLSMSSVKNPATRNMYFQLAALKADCVGDVSNYKDALDILYKIVAEAEQYKDSVTLSKNMSTIGVINYNLDHVPDAFKWYFKGLSYITDEPKFYSSAIVLYINLAETYRWVKQPDSALYFIDKAIPLCRQTENLFFLTNALRVKASIYKDEKQYGLAEEKMLECIAINEKKEGKLTMSNEQLTLAVIYMRSGNLDNAIKIITNGLLLNNKKDSEADPLRISYYKTLAECYKLKGDNKNYQSTLEKLIVCKDAFYQANSAQGIAEAEAKYNVQKKENTILQQKYSLQKNRFLLYGSLALLAMTLIIAYYIFRDYSRKQNLKMEMAMAEEKIKSTAAVQKAEEKERVRIAADLHDNIGAYASAISADVEKITQGIKDNSISNLQNLQEHSQEIINSLRDTIWVLNKDNITITGISDRIKNYVNKLQPSYPAIQFNINEAIVNDVRISSQNALNIFRIVQEAVHNAIKHSAAEDISISISSPKNIYIQISDDGKGMEENSVITGNGLLNMKARAKQAGMDLSISSALKQGTTLILETATTN